MTTLAQITDTEHRVIKQHLLKPVKADSGWQPKLLPQP